MRIFDLFRPDVRRAKKLLEDLHRDKKSYQEEAIEGLQYLFKHHRHLPKSWRKEVVSQLLSKRSEFREKVDKALIHIAACGITEPLIEASKKGVISEYDVANILFSASIFPESELVKDKLIQSLKEIPKEAAVTPPIRTLELLKSSPVMNGWERNIVEEKIFTAVKALNELGENPLKFFHKDSLFNGVLSWYDGESKERALAIIKILTEIIGDQKMIEFLKSSLVETKHARAADQIAFLLTYVFGWTPTTRSEAFAYYWALEAWDKLREWGFIEEIEKFVNDLIKSIRNSKEWVGREITLLLDIGDKRAAEIVIDWLFDNPKRAEHFVSDYKKSSKKEELTHLFEDYTDLIFRAASFTEIVDDQSRYYTGGYSFIQRDEVRRSYSLSESNKAIERLCKIHTPISNNLLYKVANKKDIVIETYYYYSSDMDWSESETAVVSFEHQRRMAREELERRANPPYDPLAYLDEEAWKL